MKEYLIAFDSDGCVFDAMEPKHRLCFEPAAVKVFGLEKIEHEFLELWNKINLYSKTRGVNRFLGLSLIFDRMREMGHELPDTGNFKQWISQTKALSEAALKEYITKKAPNNNELIKIAKWSEEVNRLTKEISDDIKPYGNAYETISKAAKSADVAVVSSAGSDIIKEEWTKYSLFDFVSELCGQERGTKAECLGFLKAKGYKSVLMVGDAPGDMEAAISTGSLFYPIIPGQEEWSWTELKEVILWDFFSGKYQNDNKYLKEFERVILCE